MNILESLEDAWRWYQDTRIQLKLLKRLAAAHWNFLPWDGPLGKDREFVDYSGPDLAAKGAFSLKHLDDLAVVVMFSVFESEVRQHVVKEIEVEEKDLKHRAIRLAVTRAKENVERGSFFSVLEPFKDQHHDLVAQIDQVRDYRNWVAHGKRGLPRNNVDPRSAYDRLKQFLTVLERSEDLPRESAG